MRMKDEERPHYFSHKIRSE